MALDSGDMVQKRAKTNATTFVGKIRSTREVRKMRYVHSQKKLKKKLRKKTKPDSSEKSEDPVTLGTAIHKFSNLSLK
jgi:hypothetical protein